MEMLDLVKDTLAAWQRWSGLKQAHRRNDGVDDVGLEHAVQCPDPPALVEILHHQQAGLRVSHQYLGPDAEIGCTLRRLEGARHVDIELRITIHGLDEDAFATALPGGAPGKAVDTPPAWRSQDRDGRFDHDVSGPPTGEPGNGI